MSYPNRLTCVLALVVFAARSLAVSTVWNGPVAGGAFEVSTNWTNGVPGSNLDDIAIFNATRNVNGTITFSNSVTSQDLFLQNNAGRINFNIGANTYAMTRYTLVGSAAGQTNDAVFHSGTMNSGLVLIGNAIGAQNNKLTVTGPSTYWSAAGPTAAIRVGSNGGFGSELIVTGGATVASQTQAIVGLQSASNNTLTVTGAGSTFSVVHSLSIGDAIDTSLPDQTNNQLKVINGGFATVRELIVGTTEKSPNNTVTISGPGSRLNIRGGQQFPPSEVGQRSDIGRSSINNRLIVENGGMLDGGAIYHLGRNETSTGNLLSVTDGTVIGTGIEIRRGKVQIERSNVEINRVVDAIINQPLGGLLSAVFPTAEIDFRSGTLSTVNSNINNGSALLIGDGGATSATFRLKRNVDGNLGSHTFANGLRVNTNGVVRGAGNIFGNVVNDGKIEPGTSAGTSKIFGALSVNAASGAVVDLANNGLVIDWTGANQASVISSYIAHARNAGTNGLWTGGGITSNLAAADSAFGIGFADNLAPGFGRASFLGQNVDATSTLIRYTLNGDADLTGTVDISDFSRLAANFNRPATWSTGDFDYDGTTGISDFAMLAANFNRSVPASRATVPEATTTAMLIGIAALRNRRCRI